MTATAVCGRMPRPGEQVLLSQAAGAQFQGRPPQWVRPFGVNAALTEGHVYLTFVDRINQRDRTEFVRIAGLVIRP